MDFIKEFRIDLDAPENYPVTLLLKNNDSLLIDRIDDGPEEFRYKKKINIRFITISICNKNNYFNFVCFLSLEIERNLQ